MQRQSQEFLFELLQTPSVSGFEMQIQKLIRRHVSKFADDVVADIHGNLIATVNKGGTVRVMLAGHCDQIGLMITHIDDNGYLYFQQVGGIDPAVLPGSGVTIYTREGKLCGVIGHKPVHLLSSEERGKRLELKKMWIDIGAADGKEAKTKVAVGDVATYQLGVERLGSHRVASAGCDDRVGVFVVMEALRLIKKALRGKRKHPLQVFAVSTVQEELGLRGARTSCFGLDPKVGIAVDVTHASDNPGSEPKEVGMVKLGEGPSIARGANINPVLGELLEETARKKRLKYQRLASPGATGTDANAIQISRSGVAAALIGIPNRYMHTPVEVVDLRDLELASRIIAETVLRITPRTNFIPV